ncbi:MAG: hypothetical protein GY754_06585 [bacterium]|nr:hypothetical protein [bacterium]
MKQEIRERMESSNWNRKIASGVLEKKGKTRKRIIFYTGSFSSLAAAALLLIIFLFGTNNRLEPNQYDNFITQQLEGTYKQVFKASENDSGNGAKQDLLSGNDIDDMIDDALAAR